MDRQCRGAACSSVARWRVYVAQWRRKWETVSGPSLQVEQYGESRLSMRYRWWFSGTCPVRSCISKLARFRGRERIRARKELRGPLKAGSMRWVGP